MSKPSVMTVRIPQDLKQRIEKVAEQQGVSLNQLALYMFTREVSSFEAGVNISEFWKGYDAEQVLKDFDRVMAKVQDREVPDWDKLED